MLCWPTVTLHWQTDRCWAGASNKFINLINTERTSFQTISGLFSPSTQRRNNNWLWSQAAPNSLFIFLAAAPVVFMQNWGHRERERERERERHLLTFRSGWHSGGCSLFSSYLPDTSRYREIDWTGNKTKYISSADIYFKLSRVNIVSRFQGKERLKYLWSTSIVSWATESFNLGGEILNFLSKQFTKHRVIQEEIHCH